jgi:diacylglycerol O-acyltransferase / wax synthase
MATAQRERISGVDTAWLRMDQPTNLMMIVGVMMFEKRLDPRKVKKVLAARFLAFRRFGQRAVQDAAGAWWQADDEFDIGHHVLRATLPGAGGKAELEAFVSELASTPLDPARPLWQFHVVDNFNGGGALVTRIHHCYADGIALIQVMLSMTHATAEGSLAMEPEVFETEASGEADFWAQLLKPVAGALGSAKEIGKGLLEQGKSLAANPSTAGAALQEVAGKGMELAGEVAKLMLMGSDAQTRFKGPLGTSKVVAWATPLPLHEVKTVGKALGCSINDVLLSMAAGALRDYLLDKGDGVEGLEIRAIVPVNLRPVGQGKSLGNHFGLVFLDLPIGMEHPLERLYEIRRRMQALKGSYQPAIALALLSAVGYGPRVLQEQVTRLLGANASAVMTNVPGPGHPLYFAGRRIVELDFWVPQSGGIGMGVSILSYDKRIQFGVITDAGLVPDPDRIVGRFDDEFEKLLWHTLMSPWVDDAAAPEEKRAKPAAKGRAAPPEAKIPKRFRNL